MAIPGQMFNPRVVYLGRDGRLGLQSALGVRNLSIEEITTCAAQTTAEAKRRAVLLLDYPETHFFLTAPINSLGLIVNGRVATVDKSPFHALSNFGMEYRARVFAQPMGATHYVLSSYVGFRCQRRVHDPAYGVAGMIRSFCIQLLLAVPNLPLDWLTNVHLQSVQEGDLAALIQAFEYMLNELWELQTTRITVIIDGPHWLEEEEHRKEWQFLLFTLRRLAYHDFLRRDQRSTFKYVLIHPQVSKLSEGCQGNKAKSVELSLFVAR